MSSCEERGHLSEKPPSRSGGERGQCVGRFFLAATFGLIFGVFDGNAIGNQLTRGPIIAIPLGGDVTAGGEVTAHVEPWGAAAGALLGGMAGALVWGRYRRREERQRGAGKAVLVISGAMLPLLLGLVPFVLLITRLWWRTH